MSVGIASKFVVPGSARRRHGSWSGWPGLARSAWCRSGAAQRRTRDAGVASPPPASRPKNSGWNAAIMLVTNRSCSAGLVAFGACLVARRRRRWPSPGTRRPGHIRRLASSTWAKAKSKWPAERLVQGRVGEPALEERRGRRRRACPAAWWPAGRGPSCVRDAARAPCGSSASASSMLPSSSARPPLLRSRRAGSWAAGSSAFSIESLGFVQARRSSCISQPRLL